MSFQNTITNNGISVNVIPSFGHIVTLPEANKNSIISEVLNHKRQNGALSTMPPGFNPARYASFSYVEKVENPVSGELIHDYVERSRLARRQL